MLVTFKSSAHGDVTMFGDVAKRFLRMMGHSGTIPSAIHAEDVPAVLERLKQALASEAEKPVEEKPEENDEDQDEPPVSLSARAFPLVEMLTAAAKEGCTVSWFSN